MKYLIINQDEGDQDYDLLTEDEIELKTEGFWDIWVPVSDLELNPLLKVLEKKNLPTTGSIQIEDCDSFINFYYWVK